MKVIAFTGAGISKQSNIPTFMDQPQVREKLFRSYANKHPQEYNNIIKQLKENMNGAKPNDAHIALKDYNVQIVTMNIDGLHKEAGSTNVLELHGGLPEDEEMDFAYTLYNKPVLYGDPAPNYEKAYQLVNTLTSEDFFIVIGCSYHTAIACDLRQLAHYRGAKVIEINEDAKHNVRKTLKQIYGY